MQPRAPGGLRDYGALMLTGRQLSSCSPKLFVSSALSGSALPHPRKAPSFMSTSTGRVNHGPAMPSQRRLLRASHSAWVLARSNATAARRRQQVLQQREVWRAMRKASDLTQSTRASAPLRMMVQEATGSTSVRLPSQRRLVPSPLPLQRLPTEVRPMQAKPLEKQRFCSWGTQRSSTRTSPQPQLPALPGSSQRTQPVCCTGWSWMASMLPLKPRNLLQRR
mmetsp:Transcript_7589/g.24244  ORF Transcript_7589/g.24244 Transcript_7589/m.24244 type:complete len:222 (-) Transcript_7589:638-1303(-)